MIAPQTLEKDSQTVVPPPFQTWNNIPRQSSLNTASPSLTGMEYLRLPIAKRKENENNRNNEMQTQPRLNISYKITDDQL